MERPSILLASASPRRARLLEEAGYPFRVAPTWVDERVPDGILPAQAALELAARKAAAATAPGGAYVLAADTLLDLDGRILGKPRDVADAVRTLRALSDRDHWVLTAVALRHEGETRVGLEQTRVTFRALSDDEIARYVASGEPMDKAGAYAVQSGARDFVARLDGPLDNVVGLPMGLVRRLLAESGYPV